MDTSSWETLFPLYFEFNLLTPELRNGEIATLKKVGHKVVSENTEKKEIAMLSGRSLGELHTNLYIFPKTFFLLWDKWFARRKEFLSFFGKLSVWLVPPYLFTLIVVR